MSIVECTSGPVTYEYLMKRSKSDLAHRFLMLMDLLNKAQQENARLRERIPADDSLRRMA